VHGDLDALALEQIAERCAPCRQRVPDDAELMPVKL
jgi:hypothetical protein